MFYLVLFSAYGNILVAGRVLEYVVNVTVSEIFLISLFRFKIPGAHVLELYQVINKTICQPALS